MSQKLLIKNSNGLYDVSAFVESYVWKGRKDSSARSLEVRLKDEGKNFAKELKVDVEEGHQCIFLHEGRELFRGMFMRQEQDSNKNVSLTAYDIGIYLVNNKDSFSYMHKTASFIFKDVCKRFSIPYKNVAETSYIIDELPKPSTTGFDAISDALKMTFDATGRRYSLICEGETLSLIRRVEDPVLWLIKDGDNLLDFDYLKSIEKTKTRIKLLSRDNRLAKSKINTEIEKKIGIFQDIAFVSGGMGEAKLQELIGAMMAEKARPESLLKVRAIGLDDLISGRCVFVEIENLALSSRFYIESDKHIFKGGLYTMELALRPVSDLDLKG